MRLAAFASARCVVSSFILSLIVEYPAFHSFVPLTPIQFLCSRSYTTCITTVDSMDEELSISQLAERDAPALMMTENMVTCLRACMLFATGRRASRVHLVGSGY